MFIVLETSFLFKKYFLFANIFVVYYYKNVWSKTISHWNCLISSILWICSYSNLNKIPRFRGWQNVRFDPNDPEKNIKRISYLYDANLVNNIGILTGEPSGVVVMDIEKEGLPWWNELVKLNGGLPETFTVQTASGGLHYYFKYTPEISQFGNMNKILNQDIDYWTNGGQAIFPGSIGANGQPYLVKSRYIEGKPVIAEIPNWLIKLL